LRREQSAAGFGGSHRRGRGRRGHPTNPTPPLGTAVVPRAPCRAPIEPGQIPPAIAGLPRPVPPKDWFALLGDNLGAANTSLQPSMTAVNRAPPTPHPPTTPHISCGPGPSPATYISDTAVRSVRHLPLTWPSCPFPLMSFRSETGPLAPPRRGKSRPGPPVGEILFASLPTTPLHFLWPPPPTSDVPNASSPFRPRPNVPPVAASTAQSPARCSLCG
jgi:hypothetical protein